MISLAGRTSGALLTAGLFLPFACHHADGGASHSTETLSEGFGTLTVEQVSAMVDAHAASIFDANGHGRYVKSHVPGARWVDSSDLQPSDLPPQKDRPLVFYCANEH